MANALRARNDGLLNAWQRVCMENEWNFNQTTGKGAPIDTAPGKGGVYLQFERERIAANLQLAVTNVADQMHFWPRPAWFTQTIPLARSTPLQWQEQAVERKKLIAFGQRNTAVIQAAAAIVYSDPNSIGINDTATITVANPNGYSVDEVQLFYQVSDGALGAADSRFQIETTNIVASGGNLVITAQRAQFVKPSIWTVPYDITDPNGKNPNAADTQTAANFVTAVDVYRVFNDTTVSISLLSNDGTILQNFDGEILDPELGFFRLGGNFCSTVSWIKVPARIKVYYYSGEALQDGQIETELQDRIISYANAEMNEQYTSFSSWTLNRVKRDQGVMVAGGGQTGSGTWPILAKRDSNNPFGLRVGQVRAWQIASGARAIQAGGKLARSIR